MKAAINRMIRRVCIMRLWCVVCWRFLRGSFFVFRDMPQWFVEWVALMEDDVSNIDADEGDFETLVLAARDELRFRSQRKFAHDFGKDV